jgi:hypothetical protein
MKKEDSMAIEGKPHVTTQPFLSEKQEEEESNFFLFNFQPY